MLHFPLVLSPSELLSVSNRTILLSIGPALALLVYVGCGALIYWGTEACTRYRDDEIEGRTTGVSNVASRLFFSWLMRPWVKILLRTGLPADSITLLSLGLALLSGVALAAGQFSVGGWFYLVAGACDYFDGRIARQRGNACRAGGALDSIVDRYSDSAVLVGLGWHFRQSEVLFLVLLALSGSLLVPYMRAKSEAMSVGLQAVGWLQRPERVMLVGISTALSPIGDLALQQWGIERRGGAGGPQGLAILGLFILAVGTHVSAWQRARALLVRLRTDTKEAKLCVRTPVKAIVSSTLATGIDAGLVGALTWSGPAGYLPLFTAVGCLAGALVNLSVNRVWAFPTSTGGKFPQAARYAFVSLTSAGFNAVGVAVLVLFPQLPAAGAWLLVRILTFFIWTYPLFRNYVFLTETDPRSDPGSSLWRPAR